MSQENKIEAEKLSLTTDFLPSDEASCSAFTLEPGDVEGALKKVLA